MKSFATPKINSTVAFILAGMTVTTIHECSHLLAAIVIGITPNSIYPNFVITPNSITRTQSIIVAATGPLFSLTSGLLVIATASRYLRSSAASFSKLFFIWFGFLSAETGFGYFLIAPFVSGGDTGQVLSLVHANGVVYALVCTVGAAGVYGLLPIMLSRRLSVFARDKRSFFQLSMHPFWMGTIGLIVIYALVDGMILVRNSDQTGGFGIIFGLVGIATIGIFATLADYDKKSKSSNTIQLPVGVPKVGISLSALLAIFLIFGLSAGIKIG